MEREWTLLHLISILLETPAKIIINKGLWQVDGREEIQA